MVKVQWGVLALGIVLPALYCNASVINFDESGGSLVVTVDGTAISNGGRVTNLQLNSESVSFDLSLAGPLGSEAGYTQLLDFPSNAVSDVLVIQFFTDLTTFHVQIGSDSQLPTIPNGAIDLTTIPQQHLPADPFYETGALQSVGTTFGTAPGGGNDTFFIRSDGAVPEPASVTLLGLGLALCAAFARRRVSAALHNR